MNYDELKRRMLGLPLKNSEAGTQKFSVLWGLPVLSSDAISSVAYATEEILLVLVPVLVFGSYEPMLAAVGAIIALLFILILCYRQVIDAYPQGGGSYSVARENLGRMPSLIAAAGLIMGYVLTVAVSVSSGVAAIESAIPEASVIRLPLAVAFILLLTIGNLRGSGDSARLFGTPTYIFVFLMFTMIVVGVIKAALGMATPAATSGAFLQQTGSLTIFLFLHAFSSGCSALTGVEAISNSVPNFEDPARVRAKRTLLFLGIIVLIVFGGVSALAMLYHVAPDGGMTVIAQIAACVFGDASFMFYMVQVFTTLILLLAANTAYNGMPQLMSLLAADGYLPKRYADKVSRLVYSHGVIMVSVLAGALILAFNGETTLLVPLYAAGVFVSFTMAQGGMVIHWRKSDAEHHARRAIINGFGACVTLTVFFVIVITNFTSGAWISLVAIILIALLMWGMSRHFRNVAASLAFDDLKQARMLVNHSPVHTKVIVPAEVVNRPFIKVLNYALSLGAEIEIYHVKTSASKSRRFKTEFTKLKLSGMHLVIEKAPYRNFTETFVKHIDEELSQLGQHETLTVVMPQLITHIWDVPLHNQTTFALQTILSRRRNLAMITVPYLVEDRGNPNTAGNVVADMVEVRPADEPGD